MEDSTTFREVSKALVHLRTIFGSCSHHIVRKAVESDFHALKDLYLKSGSEQASSIQAVLRESINGFVLPDCALRLMVSKFLLRCEIGMLAPSTSWQGLGLDKFSSLKPDRQLARILLRVRWLTRA